MWNPISGGPELLDLIQPLWTELRAHHARLSSTWRATLLESTWPKRKADLIKKSPNGLLVLLAQDQTKTVAYCIATIDHTNQGEIDSLYVTPTHRRQGIARQLMTDALAWLHDHQANPILIDVLAENHEALRFYQSFNFHPRTIRLRQPPENLHP